MSVLFDNLSKNVRSAKLFGLRLVPGGAIVAWGLATGCLGGLLLIPHAPLPAPDLTDPRLRHTLAVEADAEGLVAFHALYADCRCSQRVVDHLLTSDRPAGVREIVLAVGDFPDPTHAALEQRFEVRSLTPAGLARLGIEAAPTLTVGGPAGEVRYAGGYTWTKQGLNILDLQILAAARSGPVDSVPLFGCAVSESLSSALDPLGLKGLTRR